MGRARWLIHHKLYRLFWLSRQTWECRSYLASPAPGGVVTNRQDAQLSLSISDCKIVRNETFCFLKKWTSLAVWLSWLECHPITERSWVQFLVKAPKPRLQVWSLVGVHMGGNQPMDVSFSHWRFSLSSFFSLFLSKSNEKNVLGWG